jgi:Stress-induced bacterial acidophilic repeat motif.
MNERNLKGYGFHERTADEQREIASKGGIASGKARRDMKLLRECLNEILDEDGGEYDGEIVSKRFLIAARALKYLLEDESLDAREFARMFEVVRDSCGEKPTDRSVIEMTNIDQRTIDEVEAIVLGSTEEPVEYDYDFDR